ncbi:MAG: pilus assembly protein [Paracoccaceae bacterium]
MDLTGAARRFRDGEDGAVTVDWVVITAAVVGLALAAFVAVAGGVMDVADTIAHVLGTHIHADGNHYQ